MQELRYILVVLGGIAIAALLVHGLWSNKKNRQAPLKEKPFGKMEASARQREQGEFDSDGIGQVRVVSRRPEPRQYRDEDRDADIARRRSVSRHEQSHAEDEEFSTPAYAKKAMPRASAAAQERYDELLDEHDDKQHAEVVQRAAPARKPAQVNRRTPVYRGNRTQSQDEFEQQTYQGRVAYEEREALREPAYARAPKFGQNQTGQTASRYEQEERVSRETASPAYREAPVEKVWQDVYVINVMARLGQELQGASLIASLMSLGFKFGDMDIFHYHEQADGSGEVLFSMINMVKPGTFEPTRMERFSTPGVSLFMQLPLENNAAFAFEQMLQAADQLASDLDAMLTDMERSPLSDESIANYRHQLAAYESSRV